MSLLINILIAIVSATIGYYLSRVLRKKKLEEYDRIGKKILDDARREAESIKKDALLQAKEIVFQAKSEVENEIKAKRQELQRIEQRLSQKEASFDKKLELLERKEREIERKEEELESKAQEFDRKLREYEALIEKEKEELERIAGMSQEEAKTILLQKVEEEAKYEAARILKRVEEETREKAEKKAREIIALAVQRYAGEYVIEETVSVVPLPNEEMKGRIIGREGRNIRALEALTGVDIIIDDTPEAVVLSCFNPIRREVARLALERLIMDGRIHPARIEEVVSKVAEELEERIKDAGEKAVFDLGLHNVHPELIKLIGKLQFRSSYAQNVYRHSIEVAFICGIMASELGINVKDAKRAGLLHDIGKALDHEVEGSHSKIGADLAKRYGENEDIVHAILAHHEEVEAQSVLDVIVQAADALSGARPGARREMLQTYIKRLEDLERIANSFPGVEKSYAIQAGREVRIVVNSDLVNDDDLYLLSREIARKIESELSYPGQIKVVVIREKRAVEYAR